MASQQVGRPVVAVVGSQQALVRSKDHIELLRASGWEALPYVSVNDVRKCAVEYPPDLLVVLDDQPKGNDLVQQYRSWKEHPLAVWVTLNNQSVSLSADVKLLGKQTTSLVLLANVKSLYSNLGSGMSS